MRFEFATSARVIFGQGTTRELGPVVREFGARALVVTGRTPDRLGPAFDSLAASGIEVAQFPVAGEPSVASVEAGLRLARAEQCEVILGVGGGSALDAAKAIAGLLTNPGELLDYLEVVGHGQPLRQPGAPFIAVPTTAGAGAEVTRNAVLASPTHRVKASLRSPFLLAKVALVDPDLTRHLPPAVTAATGLDALTQLIEPFVSCRANPLTDALCREGMTRAARSLRRAFLDGDDATARTDMALAALFSGMALANAGLGAVHGFAAPIGGSFNAPHGAVCAVLLPLAMEINIRALRERQPASEALARYAEVASLLTRRAQATPEDGIAWVKETCLALAIPPLRSYGITPRDMPSLCEKAAVASSMKGNPIALTPAELNKLLERAL